MFVWCSGLIMVLIVCLNGLTGTRQVGQLLTREGNRAEQVQPQAPAAAPAQGAGLDRVGDPLPAHAVARLGSLRFRHDAPLVAVAISPDGGVIATTGLGTTVASILVLWDARTGQALHRLRLTASGMTFSPDSKFLATFDGFSRTIRLTDVVTGKTVREFAGADGNGAGSSPRGTLLAYLPGGKQLLLRDSREAVVRLFDIEAEKESRSFHLGNVRITSSALSPQGQWLAVGEQGGTVRLWDVAQGNERFQLNKHTRDCLSIGFAPDGRTLATGGRDGHVHLWDTATGEHVRALRGMVNRPGPPNAPAPGKAMLVPAGDVFELAYSPDGKTLVASYNPCFIVWDPETGADLRQFANEPSTAMRFLPDGKTLLAGPPTAGMPRLNTLRFVDPVTGQRVRQGEGHESTVEAVAFSPDGKWIATAAGLFVTEVFVWEVGSGQVSFRDRLPPLGRPERLVFAPKGDLLAAGCSGSVVVWNLKTRKQLWVLRPPRTPAGRRNPTKPMVLAFSADGSRLAATMSNGDVRLWDMSSGRESLTYHALKPGSVLALSPDLKRAASHDENTDVISIRELATGTEVAQIQRERAGPQAPVAGIQLAFSPDSQVLSEISGLRKLLLWDPVTGQSLGSAPLPGWYPSTVAWSPDGRLIALAGLRPPAVGPTEGKVLTAPIQIYDLNTKQYLPTLLAGHEGNIVGLSFSPDSRTLASASSDTTVLLWDVAGIIVPAGISRGLKGNTLD